MTRLALVMRSLRHYWRANLVVVLGVTTAVAVLGGALVVGESVRGTLRDLALSRLGSTDVAVTLPGFFRQALASDIAQDAGFGSRFRSVAPLIAVDGFVTAQSSGRRAGNVRVYGVDDRFWEFNGRAPRLLDARQAYVSPALADELGADEGQAILVRLQLPSDVPLESLHGRKEDPGRSVRATVISVLPAEDLGEFALSQEQGRIRAVFVSMKWLGEQLDIDGRANTLVVSARDGPDSPGGALMPIIRRAVTTDDMGLTIAASIPDRAIIVGSEAGLLDDARADAVRRAATVAGLQPEPILTYLANTIRVGTREVPYSLVTARELSGIDGGQGLSNADGGQTGGAPPIVLNTWAARELQAKIGDSVHLDYYVWVEPGQLITREAEFRLARVDPIGPNDRNLAPVYPGITDSPTLDEWDPPFPLDLKRVRPADEAYWREYRTTPKAFIPIAEGQRLWGSRYGHVTSLRLTMPGGAADPPQLENGRAALANALRPELEPAALGFVLRDVRAEAIAASAGVTDFGQYFVYFSFFLVISSLVLAALFFKLGVDERVREIGLLAAVGARDEFVRRAFLTEAVILSVAGGVLGSVAALGYAAVIINLLGTWWVDAVGTTSLALHASPQALATGFAGGVAAALGCTWATLRGLRGLSPRSLLAGVTASDAGARATPTRAAVVAGSAAVLSLALMASSVAGFVPAAGAFFGAAFLMLVAGLAAVTSWYRRRPSSLLSGAGAAAIVRLGLRNASSKPARSALAISVIAAAVFILLAVDVFRKDDASDGGPNSGVGGYQLVADSLLPIAFDLGTAAGRESAGLTDLDGARFDAFRVRPGDDTSCLNLYQPTNPRMLGVPQSFIERGRFRFSASIAGDEPARANPWTLLNASQPDGAVPAIVDANSLTYVLHKAVGDLIEIPHAGVTVRLRVVAALSDSLFQREILVSDSAFVRLFPDYEGYRFFLVEDSAASSTDTATAIEDRLSAFGVDVLLSKDRLAEFHRVENTYLATFQTLGGLGLLLGTVGLSAVLLRNVVERRRELALLGAVGFQPRHLRLMLLAESGSLLVFGLAIGAAAATVASVPALVERGGRLPFSPVGALVIAGVLLAGLASTAIAARAATRHFQLGALRSE